MKRKLYIIAFTIQGLLMCVVLCWILWAFTGYDGSGGIVGYVTIPDILYFMTAVFFSETTACFAAPFSIVCFVIAIILMLKQKNNKDDDKISKSFGVFFCITIINTFIYSNLFLFYLFPPESWP